MKRAHGIDFNLFGDDMQFVEIALDSNESVVAEAGAMMYMENGIEMDAVFGDGSDNDSKKGFMDKVIGAGKRILTGESLFMTVFTNKAHERKSLAFAAPYPGKIIPLDLANQGGQIICQRDAFLCAAKGIQIEIAFQKNLGKGLFGGEGFIMQRLIGDGLTFLHAGGTIIEKKLEPKEVMRFDTGCLVAMTSTINYNVEFVKNVKSAFFGGEGLFLATLEGPGHVWLQSIPFSRLANRIIAAASKSVGGKSKGEASILGGIGLGDLLGKD